MRKKIKEIMNKEEGFTLVELLAVIVILGIIVAIAVPGIGRVIENSRTKANAAEVELVKDAARIYFTTDAEKIKENGSAEVEVSDLIKEGYLDVSSIEGDEAPTGKVTRSVDKEGKVTLTYPQSS